MRPEHIIMTRVDEATTMELEIYSGSVRDQLILIREAVHSIRTGAVREFKFTVQAKEWTMTVEARK